MKPTQQEIIELARELRRIANPNESRIYQHERGKLFEAARMLERFGAGGGGGETVLAAVFDENLGRPKLVEGCPELYHGQKLYTQPSPTNLRAEYLRGLDDAKKIASNYGPSRPIVTKTPSQRIVGRWEGEQAASAGIADAIEALKGKK